MVTIPELKKALGSRAENMSEEQLVELNLSFERLSNALFDRWIKDMRRPEDKNHE